MPPEGIIVEIPLVLGKSVETFEELAALIAGNGVGMRVVGPHHVVLQRGVG